MEVIVSKDLKFFKCGICGNIAELIEDSGVRMVCCDQNMTLLVANTVEASIEKHIPAITKMDTCVCGSGDCASSIKVQIGSVIHPMTADHHILFVVLETENGAKRRMLDVGAEPIVTFCCCDDKAIAAYAYCNLHGLWKADV